jgi:hypothetical protein
MITDEQLKADIREQMTVKKLNTSQLERLSGFYGLRLYLNTPGRSITIVNACKVAVALE